MVLGEIARAIDPLRLPDDVARFWRGVDPASIIVAPYPSPTSVSFCLDTWRSHAEEFASMTPKLLFPFCYESHGFLFVELHDDRRMGGTVFQWGYAGSPFFRRFGSITGYLDQLAAFVERTPVQRNETDDGRVWYHAEWDIRDWEDATATRLAVAPPHPRYGTQTRFDEDVRNWPRHWLAAQGLTEEDRRPKGATTTIARLLSAAAQGDTAEGRVHARVVALAGTSGGSRAKIDDGTATVDVWCPVGVSAYGPTRGARLEFDLVVTAGRDPDVDSSAEHAAVTRHALDGDLDAAGEAALALHARLFGTPAAAEATAIRPLD